MEGEEALWSPFSTLNRILEILADSTGSLARGGRHKHQFLEITKFFFKSWINIFLCLAIRNFCIISLVQKTSNFKLFFTVYIHMSQYMPFCFEVSIVIPMQATAAPTSKSPVQPKANLTTGIWNNDNICQLFESIVLFLKTSNHGSGICFFCSVIRQECKTFLSLRWKSQIPIQQKTLLL